MNKLEALQSKVEEYEFKGMIFKIFGLTFPELTYVAELTDQKKFKEINEFMVFTVLRKNLPTKEQDPEKGCSDEEIKTGINTFISGEFGYNVCKIVQKLSGLIPEQEKK